MPIARRKLPSPKAGTAPRRQSPEPGFALLRPRPAAKPGATVWALRNRCLLGQAMALALWNAPAFAQNVITTDGRTQTAIAVEGATTTITTKTISGGAGYNSFNRFEQGAGSTVNMHLPQNTGALVNIVRNGPVVVNGILNSYRNGSIGGHVYFSDSAGFTVGPSGVINTGRLTVNTPTREFLEGVVGPGGVVNEGLAARLRANDVPISPDGAISIEGRINARQGVTLHGHSVSVSGQITTNAAPVDVGERRRRHQTAFSASVNTSGVKHGGAMVARKGGGIEIVAADTARISGTLTANASGRRSAGAITVHSGRGTVVTGTARLSAQGAAPSPRASASASSGPPAVNTGDGGKISLTSDTTIAIARGAHFDVSAAQNAAGNGGSVMVMAGTNLDVEAGAVFRGKGGLTGDGGFTELSARKTVTLGAVDVDLSARSGKAGLLYIDPEDLIIGTGGSASMVTNGTNVSLEATNSITIAADGVIDTRQFNRSGGVLSAANPSTGDSGSITLTAPNISVFGSLLAGVSTGSAFAAGDVTLNATKSHTLAAGIASATATIDIHGTITGRDVKLTTDSTAIASYVDSSAGSLLVLAAQTRAGILFGLNGGYVGSQALSRIRVVDGATIEATRDVSITAKARQEASLPAITLTGLSPFGAAAAIGEISGTVTTDIASGATITVGRNLAVKSENDVKLAVAAITITVGDAVAASSFAYGNVDVTTSAKVHSGATITAGSGAGTGNVSVTAINTNNLSTSATSVAAAGGLAGLAFAYAEYKSEAEALLGASLGSSANKIQHLTVEAVSDTTKNATSASTTVGNNQLFGAGPENGTKVSDVLSAILGKLQGGSNGVPLKVGSAIAIADSNLSAKAAIAADPGRTAPTIHASGEVVVAARQRDFGVRLISDSSTNSNSKDPTSSNPEAQVSLSFGIAVGNYKHDATAAIGSGVTINASRIGVAALNEIPISNTWTNWSGLGEVFSHLNGNLGIVNNILTSYANSTASGAELGLAGAVGYFRVSNDTSAYVASGATLNQTTGVGSWSTELAKDYTQQWSQGVSIVADTDQHSIDVGGNFGFSGGINGGTGSAVGGSLLSIGRSSNTVAAVAAGATITATDLSVTADTSDKMFVIATTSGRSAGTIALTGMVALAGIQNQTLASISNAAIITANSVAVKADQFVSVFALSGALTVGGGNGIGISLGVLDAGTLTRAYVGDNSNDLTDGRLAGTAPQGLITTGAIAVEASTTGRITAASVAAAAADGAVAIDLPPGTSKAVREIAADFAKTSSSGPSLSAAGTAAVALTTMGTSAWIDNARLREKDGAGLTTSVRALNSTIIEVGAGAAAANLAGTSGASGAIAGAVAIGVLDNSTDARLSGSSLTGVHDTSVQAIAGGRATIVGVGLAVSAGGNGAAAISAAVGLVTNRVNASIVNSALTAISGLSVSQIASVNAYQTTDIGIGGGAAYGGAQSGVGLSLTYASIGDPSGEDAVSATIRNSSLVNLDGLNVVASNSSRIVSGAVSAGLGGNGLSGAFVFNKVKTSTKAQISGTAGAPPTITVAGNVVVTADSSREATFDAIIAGRQTFTQADEAQVEFDGSVANGGDPNPNGAAIVAITGAVQVGKNNVGISFLSNEVAQSHIATIDNVVLTATGDVSVRAQDGASITGVAVGLGGATGQFAGVASVALQSVDNVVRAGITGTGTIITARDILLNGSTTATIRGTAGSLGLGFGSAAVGLSVVQNSIDNTVSATVEDARLRSWRDVVAKAESSGRISTLAIGIAISRQVGLAGSVATSSIGTDVAATVKRADIVAENNVGVIATNHDGIAVSAGALGAAGGSPSVAGGLSVVNNSIGGSTVASIGEASSVDARVNGTGSLTISSGAVVSPPSLSSPSGPSTALPDLAMATRSVRGLAVVATSRQAVMANAVTAGIAVYPISGAVGYVTIRNSLGGETLASIDGSMIDTRLAGGQNPTAIVVDAASHSYAGSYVVVGAIGGAAGAGADAQTTLKRRTSASLTNSTTGTISTSQAGLGGVGAVQVSAVSTQASTGKTIGFAAGVLGAAASGLVNSFEAVTTATVDQGILNAASLRVTADSTNGFYGVAGVGAGGGVALGSAFVVARSQNTTLATVGGGANVTTMSIFGRLDVLATSNNSFTALAAGGAAAGLVGIAGMVNLIDVANTTRAGLYGVNSIQRRTSIQELAGQTIDASLNVIARETTTITPETGVAAIGGSGIGLGSATNVASLDSSVLADLANSTVNTTGAVVVQAVSDRSVDANAFTIGQGGSLGLGAAVNVISVGAGAPSGADLNIGGDGTLSRVNQLTAVDPGFLLSTSGLATYRTLPGVNPAGRTDEQLRAAANTEYLALIQNGVVVNGVLTLTSSGVEALRANAATALSQTSPTDSQVRDYAAARYTALKAANLQYVIGEAGLNSYRDIVQAGTPNAPDAQVKIAANDAFATLLANGVPINGLYSLRGSGQAVYQAAADLELGRTATFGEVSAYAASQYAWFVSNRARTATPSAISATALLDSTGAQTGASALGGTITATSVSVTSTSKTSTDNTALGVGVGGLGVGAALGYTTVADAVSAGLDQMTVTTGSITVNASAIDGAAGAASRIAVEAGAGAGTAAAGAAVAQGAVSNTLTARLGGTLTVTGATTVSASTTQGSRADALGAAVAGGALGVSLASSSLNGTAKADLAANATLSGGTSLSVTATSNGISYASATAGAGGLLIAGFGADVSATDTSRVEARLGDNASVNVGTGAITVSATATPDAKAAAYGVSVTGGLAVGVAISRATVNQTVIAAMDGGAAAQRALTAGTLSILATSSIFGTPVTSIGGAPGKTDQFSRGGTGAAAWSFAGSGAYYASAVGSDAGASTSSTVTASAGNFVRLPNGVVAITATNTTRQVASSTGFSIAGKYSVGAVLADARSTATTSATLGDDARMAGNGASSFSLTATGSDTQIAKAVSGSGGLVAGAGAQADTANTAAVTARVGARAQISANTILVNAQHTDAYANLVDAVQAAALGASASLASHNATSNVLVDIGNTVTFAAFGTGTRGCYVTSCIQGVELESRNIFRQLALGDTISAGAGGGINGVGAKSTVGIDGNSRVVVGNDATFASGGNTLASPGPIAIQAITELDADDTVTLTTGGLLQGSGVTSQYRADTDNEVTLGTSNTLTSAGTINVGAYTTAHVKTNALVTTYGLAAVGVAEADTNIRTDQTINIGANSTLTGLDNVNVTAGRDASGIATTGIYGDATAVGYVRGLIAVPDADAATDLQNHARLNIASGAALLSAQNVTLGAYNGTVTPNARGAGHGFQLYLIPVTQRDESPGSAATSTVVMNGRAVGGVFREQQIIIGCGANGGSICGTTEQPTVYIKAGGAPVTVTHDPSFNAVDYVRANYTTFNGTIADTAVADTLVGGVAQHLVRAYRISQLYAAGGNVFVNGDTIQGNGTLTANGGPTITVVNNSAAYLILDGGAYIPDLSTGQILFTGAAQGQNGLTQNAVNANGTASVIINNAYTRADVGDYGPALLIGGDITNLGGLVSINNTQGSFGFSGQRIDALQFNVTVPNGAVAVASNGPNGMYNAGASPQAEWDHAITYPGATPGQPSQNYVINNTINAIANTLYFGSGGSLNYNLYHNINDGSNAGLRYSTIFYGNCIGYGATGMNCVGGYDFGNGINFALIPIVPKYYQNDSVQAQGGGAQIYGAQVAIKASVININASIEAGRVTNRAVTIDQSYANSLEGSRDAYLRDGYSMRTMAELFPDEAYWKAATTVQVSYDFVNRRFILDDTNASSGGGSVLLDGQIISTNQLGRIKINGGFGHVTVNNNTDRELVVNRINTGTAAGANASISKITIVDRLKPANADTTVYVYTPGSGIAKYVTENGRQPILSGANATAPAQFIAGDTTSYDTRDGTRYEWTQQLFVTKDGLVVNNPNAQGVWRYNSGTANNPWVYVPAPASGIWGDGNSSGPDYWNQSTTPQGRVTYNQFHAVSNPVFYQTLQGGVVEVINAQQTYGRCNGGNPSFCDFDFRGDTGSTANSYWNYNYVKDAWLQVTSSVRADYDFGISFAGNASGLVTINSNAAIRQQGNIVNPSGATTISAHAGSFTQAPNVSILSNHLTITGRNSVGTADAPIQATLTSGAAIAAYSGAGGIHLNIDSDAKIWRFNADLDAGSGRYGDINVRATGGLEVASWADPNYIHALGNNITIRSRDGAVGGIATPLRIQAMATTLANGSQTGGVVNISAQGDIGIRQLTGNLRVGQIASTGGNVRVDVVSGTLKAANAQTAAQSLSTEQLSAISGKLKLTQADGADAAAQASVAAFERSVNETYTLYTSLVRNGTVTNGVFRLGDAAIPLYQTLANLALGRTANADEVRAYAAERYAGYAGVFDKAYGAGWSSTSRFQATSLENGFSFSATAQNATPGLAAGDTVRQLGVTTFERNVTATYGLYSGLIANGTVTNGVFTLNQPAIAAYQSAADAALGRSANETEVRAHAAGLYTSYAATFSSAYGDNWSSQARFQPATLESNYSFSVAAPDARPGLATSTTVAQLGVSVFERNVNETYGLYSALIGSGTVANGAFTLNQAAIGGYQAAANAALGRTATSAEVSAYAADRYAGYAATFSAAYGDGWANQVSQNFNASVADARPGLASSITANSVWQTGQLVAAIDQAALQPASGVVGNGTPIIMGRDVTLNIGGSIGSLAPDVAVSLDAIRNGTLSTAQLQALAVATTPGSVKLVGTNAGGQRVDVTSIGTVPLGVTLTSVDIAQTAPLFISATGTFSGSAQGDIYLQSTTAGQAGGGSLHLGRVTATGAINLQAPQAITVATAPSSTTPLHAVQIQAGTDLTLSAAGGGIGSAATPLTYQIGGRLISASAGAGDAWLVKPTGNVEIGRIFAQGTASLTAGAGSISGYLPGVAISAQTVVLNASGNVGSATTAFAVQSASDGEISGQIGGSGWISTPTLASQTAIAQRIGALTAAGSLTLTADAEMRVLRSLGATTGALSATAGAIVMEAAATATAAGGITLASATDVTLGRVVSGLVAPQGMASIAVTAAGAIFGHAGVVNLDAAQTGGVIALASGSGIGTQLAAVGFVAPSLSARSLQGNVNLKTASTTRVTSLTADAGSAAIAADGALTVDALTSGGAASATSTGSTLTVTTLNAGGTATLTAAGPVTIGSARTTNGDLSVASLTAGIVATTLEAAAALALTAPGAITVATAASGTTTQATSSSDALSITTLTAGGAATLAGRNGVTLGSATTTAGALTIGSSHAGITAATLHAAGAAGLTAAGAIAVTASLTSGGGATIASNGGALDVVALTAGGSSTLSGWGAVTLGTARTTGGDLSVASLTAGIDATTLAAAGALSLNAPGAIDVGTATSGATTQATSSADTLSIAMLTSGGTATLAGRNGVTLGSATTDTGDLVATSSHAGITAATLNVAGAANLAAAQAIGIGTLTSGGRSDVQSSGGAIDVATLTAGGTMFVNGATSVTLGTASTSAGDLRVRSGGAITATSLSGAQGVEATAAAAIAIGSLTSGDATSATSTAGTLRIDMLSSGRSATLAATGGIVFDSAETRAGDLVATSAAGIQARSLSAAETLTLSARDLIALTQASSGGGMSIVSSAGLVRAATLRSGATMTVVGAAGVDLQTALAMTGDVVLRSANAGLTLGDIAAARDATLQAQGTIAAGSLTAGRDLRAASVGATLAIRAFAASRDVSLSANSAIALDDAEAGRDLSITSSAGGVSLRTARAGGTVGLDAAGLLSMTALRSGGRATLSGGALSIGELIAGDTATLRASGAANLGSVSTLLGDIAIASAAGRIDATALDAAGALALQAASAIQVGTARSGGDAGLVSTASDVTVARLTAGGEGRLVADGAVRLGEGGAGGSLTLSSAGSLVSVGSARAGGDIAVTAQSIVFGGLDTGRDARLSSAGLIDGESIVATQTLTALAGTSGAGSIRIAVGAARNSAFTAPDDVRLGRYGAGDSIVILGNTIVSDIVQLAGASGAPLDLTIAGSRQRTAETVALSLDAASFRTTRFETVDGALTTTSRRFDLLQTFVPGALRLDAPGLRVLANNRSPAPLTGFDVQLYQRNRPFFVSLNGGSLTTNAMVIRFDAGQVSIPAGNGGEPEVSIARDMPRLGASMPTGPSFGEIARGFVLDETGRWRSTDPETTASLGGDVATRVNLSGGGEQP